MKRGRLFSCKRLSHVGSWAGFLILLGCGDEDPSRPSAARVFHATADGAGSDCGTVQECVDQAAPGDTVELAGGIYDDPADTLVSLPGDPPIVANIVARPGIVLRARAGVEVRIDGRWDAGRIGVLVPEGVSDVTIQGIRFDNCDPGVHATGGRLKIENCAFVTGGHGLVAVGTELDVSGSRFEEYVNDGVVLRDCSGRLGTSSFRGNGYFLFSAGSRDLVLEDLLLTYACFTGIRIEEGGTATARRITLVGAGMVPDADSTAIVVAGNARLVLAQSIVSENRGYGVHCRAGGSVTITCSNFFNNSSGNYQGCPDATGMDGNLAVDPRFCSFPDGDFHLVATSPLRQAGCGEMGVFGNLPCELRGEGPHVPWLSSVGWRRLGGPGEQDDPGEHEPD
jgi:hypothetical protein